MRYPIRLLPLASTLALAACFSSAAPPQTFSAPPAADLAVEAEPAIPVEAATSEAAYEGYNQAVLDWGRRGWAAVARLCRWTASHGAAVGCLEAPQAFQKP